MALPQILSTLREELKKLIPDGKTVVSSIALRDIVYTGNSRDSKAVDSIYWTDLRPGPGETVLIGSIMFDMEKKKVGRHVQIVDMVDERKLKVIEPRTPYDDVTLLPTWRAEIGGRFAPLYEYPIPFQIDDYLIGSMVPVAVIKIKVDR